METKINQVIQEIPDKPATWKHLLSSELHMLYMLLSCPVEGKFKLYLVGINTVNFESFWLQLTFTTVVEIGPGSYRRQESELFEH